MDVAGASSVTPTGPNIAKFQFFNINKAIPTQTDKKQTTTAKVVRLKT